MPLDGNPTGELFLATTMFKAMPAEESGRRFIYIEASDESLDYENERVLQKALAESADYYLRFGNIDLDHITQTGARKGITDYMAYEIGRPIEVKASGKKTFVKGEIFSGDAPVNANARMFWDSLHLRPPQRWYPSVAGSIEDRRPGPNNTRVIHKVRWTNIGMSKTPVNLNVPVSTHAPFGPLTKALEAAYPEAMLKSLAAGYGTDVAQLSGGGALRKQSSTRRVANYFDFRDRMAGAALAKGGPTDAASMVAHATEHFGIGESEAADYTGRFLDDLRTGISHKRKVT